MHAALPEKYYLAHAQEIFDFAEHQSAHLLDQAERRYLRKYAQLSEDAQCLLIRILSRKPKYFAVQSLAYAEIGNIARAQDELLRDGFISYVETRDWLEFLPALNKPQLIDCLNAARIQVKRSTNKSALLELAMAHCQPQHNAQLRAQFIVRRQQATIEYILFLFFGDLRNRLQKFAMRDLGVLKTRKTNAQKIARFEAPVEARSAFTLQRLAQNFKAQPEQLCEQAAEYLVTHKPVGAIAEQLSDKLLLAVGDQLSGTDRRKAIDLWQRSNEPTAAQRWIREEYQHGDREALRLVLEELRDEQLAPEVAIFVEDFYSRKYLGKRTTIYTDLLRHQSAKVPIDEVYVNQAEEGVIQYYQQRGIQAYFVENSHWRLLFALTFWPLLFDQKTQRGSEFDRLPLSLRDQSFYAKFSEQIEHCLTALDEREASLARFAALATRYYGFATGLFRWNARILETIKLCLELAPRGSLAKVLRPMAKHYRHSKDGYPDLMVIENGKLRFEEVKAPGDVLRPNQLISINRLRQAGLAVQLTQVEWRTDPQQCYAVVDIETTGGRKSGNAITEIAVVKVRNQQIISEWSTLVNPCRRIPPHITHLTGIDNHMVAKAPLFADIADELEQQLQDAIFVAHNVGFDYGFIKSAYAAINRSFRKPKYCTVRNSRKAFPGLKSYSLGNLCEHFDIDLRNHHRALADATATAHLLRLIQQA